MKDESINLVTFTVQNHELFNYSSASWNAENGARMRKLCNFSQAVLQIIQEAIRNFLT